MATSASECEASAAIAAEPGKTAAPALGKADHEVRRQGHQYSPRAVVWHRPALYSLEAWEDCNFERGRWALFGSAGERATRRACSSGVGAKVICTDPGPRPPMLRHRTRSV